MHVRVCQIPAQNLMLLPRGNDERKEPVVFEVGAPPSQVLHDVQVLGKEPSTHNGNAPGLLPFRCATNDLCDGEDLTRLRINEARTKPKSGTQRNVV
jgi:hypothetical protein